MSLFVILFDDEITALKIRNVKIIIRNNLLNVYSYFQVDGAYKNINWANIGSITSWHAPITHFLSRGETYHYKIECYQFKNKYYSEYKIYRWKS